MVDEPDPPGGGLGRDHLPPARRPGRRAGGRPRRPGGGAGRAGGDRQPERGPLPRLVLRGVRVGPGAGADQLPAHGRRGRLHRRALRRHGPARRPRAGRASVGGQGRPPRRPRGRHGPGAVPARGAGPRAGTPDEDATATVNYTSGTTARPKGVQLTHRTLWVNAVTFGWHAGVSMRDVYLHTLPDVPRQRLGHAVHHHGHGRPPRGAAQGRRRRDPAPGRAPRGHADVRRPGGGGHGARRRGHVGRADPGRGHHPHRRGRRPAARPGPSSGWRPSWAGSSSRSTG